jgi:hypothetical protein
MSEENMSKLKAVFDAAKKNHDAHAMEADANAAARLIQNTIKSNSLQRA